MRSTWCRKLWAILSLSSVAALAQAQSTWPPFNVESVQGGKATATQITPLTKASRKWKLCVLIPHLKDSYWSAVDYGVISEARRIGVSATILQAGGYDKLPVQVSQFDDCLASGADAIVVAPISEAGLTAKFKQSQAKGIPTVVFINPVDSAPVTSKIFVDFQTKGALTGTYLKNALGAAGGQVVAFPGPQGSGWAESYLKGFQSSMNGGKVKVLDVKFGEAGVPEQLHLVEDALQTYSGVNAVWGAAPAAEAAVGAVSEAGLNKVTIVSSYENQAMLDLLRSGKIAAFATEFPTMQARAAVDLAVRALEKQPVAPQYRVVPKMVTRESVAQIDTTQILAPANWRPVFEQK
ncbi:TMAO reductase system periplasmic protein TorT [Paraburkholderia acidisoli]|uniref:TMAO reductase system periplasmic protein TorT n=1 Tax=Paraburkholderia acidisoli TaxID=2571748 RepID=A0A7Z2GME5_9BURK|nr:TMAO reductase system periplasmic protein TorT [Paraburkholderia acidisoli]QGZ64271.1 TMAO reductase system periplasmic protein TorT [Paraburkholderia acidisoli]